MVTYDSEIPFIGIYLEKFKTLIWKDTCTPMFNAALFRRAKILKQPECLSTDNWVKMCDIYILLGHKKEWNLTICNNIEGPREYYPE